MTDSGEFVEVQGTAEGAPVSRQRLNALVDLAAEGIGELLAIQRRVLGL
jgi:ribonuclease PH